MPASISLSSRRPYLFRAMYEWICDNDLSAHIVVDANYPGVTVPQEHVQEGRIVLNIAPRAISEYSCDNKDLAFTARFQGTPFAICVPMNALSAIFASENGEGMVFEPVEPPSSPPPEGGDDEKPPQGPALRVVK